MHSSINSSIHPFIQACIHAFIHASIHPFIHAGATIPTGMTSRSMRSLLDAHAPTPKPRSFVKSGLAEWRMVVQTNPGDGKSYKLICCKGECPESPSTAPEPADGYTTMLICVDDDPAPRANSRDVISVEATGADMDGL